jgi:hypothetical protein
MPHTLPPNLAALMTDPRLSLHDGRFHEFTVDTRSSAITIAIDCGDLQVGYRRLTLSFEGASIVPNDLRLLADAVGAQYRPNHWHQGRTVTEVLEHKVADLPGGRFVLRLRLWPFYQFAIEFSGFSCSRFQWRTGGQPARDASRCCLNPTDIPAR